MMLLLLLLQILPTKTKHHHEEDFILRTSDAKNIGEKSSHLLNALSQNRHYFRLHPASVKQLLRDEMLTRLCRRFLEKKGFTVITSSSSSSSRRSEVSM